VLRPRQVTTGMHLGNVGEVRQMSSWRWLPPWSPFWLPSPLPPFQPGAFMKCDRLLLFSGFLLRITSFAQSQTYSASGNRMQESVFRWAGPQATGLEPC